MTEDEEMSDLDKRFLDTVEKQILADVPRDSRLTNFSRLRVEDALRVVSLAQAPQAENERLREALHKSKATLNIMANKALEVGLEGTSEWDKIAGTADLHGCVLMINAALHPGLKAYLRDQPASGERE